jgi:hypothetical protein
VQVLDGGFGAWSARTPVTRRPRRRPRAAGPGRRRTQPIATGAT